MTIQLDVDEAERLLAVLRSQHLGRDARLIAIEEKIERALSDLVDERSAESFPASDPPAR